MTTAPATASLSTGDEAIATAGQRNCRTSGFREQLKKLPQRIQDAAAAAFSVFLRDPFDPTLDNKALVDTAQGRHRIGSRRVRVTMRYRAIYVVDGDMNVWYWIGSHEDCNNFVGRK